VRNRRFDDATTSEQYIRRLLGLPEHVKVECIVSIGHPAEKREPVPAEELKVSKIRMNSEGGEP